MAIEDLDEDSRVTGLREDRLKAYRARPDDISSHYNDEGENEENYYGRFAYELIQNADDAVGRLPESSQNPRRARFEIRTDPEPVLIVANSGPPVDGADARALTNIGATTKGADDDHASIGHKGRGFSSVLEITEEPHVYSTDVSFVFDRERSARLIRPLVRNLDDWSLDDVEGIPLMRLPFGPDTVPDRVQDLLEEDYETVFWFPLRDGVVDDVRESLLGLDDQTVLFLQNLESLQVDVDGVEASWSIQRTKGPPDSDGLTGETQDELESDIDVVTIDHRGTTRTQSQSYLRFHRSNIPLGSHTEGISNNTWGDISRTRVSVAVRFENDDGVIVEPVEDPNAHVFLPTEERSPVPVLINGAFDTDLARRSIEFTAKDNDYNRFLVKRVADILATDLSAVVRETSTPAATFFECVDFSTWADPASRDELSFRDELIRSLRAALQDVDCVPVAGTVNRSDGPAYVAPTQTFVPPFADTIEGAVTTFVDAWGAGTITVSSDETTRRGYLPDTSLLTAMDAVPQLLELYGAEQLPPAEIPRLVAEFPDSFGRLENYPPVPQTAADDPVVELVGAFWRELDDEQRDAYETAARTVPLLPVGTPADDGTVERVRADEAEVYVPREETGAVALPGVRFVTRAVYYQRDRLSNQSVPPKIDRRQRTIERIWDPNPFQFEDLVRTTIRPRIPEHEPDPSDELVDYEVLSVVETFGRESMAPESPLPLTDRNDSEPLYWLCRLPVPTKKDGWQPAHTVYFGEQWVPEGPAVRSVEPLFERADVEAPFLVAPETLAKELGLELDTDDDNDDAFDREQWFQFFKWIGVAPHLRLQPLFEPMERQQFSATIAKGGVNRPDGGQSVLGALESKAWDKYRAHLEAALDELDEDDREGYDSIYEINGLENWSTLARAAQSDAEFGSDLFDHLVIWWDAVFSDYTEAVLATHSVDGFGRRNDSVPKSGERRRTGTNLWLWQLQTTPWCPSSRGATTPDQVWDISPQQATTFAIGEQPLLPLLAHNLDPESYDAESLLDALSIRQHLTEETFSPKDARIVCEAVESVCADTEEQIEKLLRDIQPVYRKVQDFSPRVDEPLPEESPWQSAPSELHDCPLLCRVEDEFAFRDAESIYFVRSPSLRTQVPFDDLPIFVLEERRAARIGGHFGLYDLDEELTTDGEPINDRSDATDTVKDHLENCAPYLLCRLEAERPSQRMIDRDRQQLETFCTHLEVVDEIEVTYTLSGDGPGASPREQTKTTEYFARTEVLESGERKIPFVSYRPNTRDRRRLLASALSTYLDVTLFEGFDALLAANSDRERQQYLRYADAPSSATAIEQKREEFGTDTDGTVIWGTDRPTPGDLDSDTDEPEADTDGKTTGGLGGGTTAEDGSTEPAVDDDAINDELYSMAELRIGDTEIVESAQTPSGEMTINTPSDPVEVEAKDGSERAGESTTSDDRVGAQSQYSIEDLGLALVKEYEAYRLLGENPEIDDPRQYVFETDERSKVAAMVEDDDHVAHAAITTLIEEPGIPLHFPGFDLLTVDPETREPDRLIELKSSKVRRRKPTISWNQWTTARDEWIQSRTRPLYYLYVAGHLSKTSGSEPYVREIPNPFRLLDGTVEHKVNVRREVQVDVNVFSDVETVRETSFNHAEPDF
jgi:hypothetical protein